MAFVIKEAGTFSNFFVGSEPTDFILAASEPNRRLLIGNTCNQLAALEVYSNVANVNGNVLATHMSTNTMNSTSIDLYMPSTGGSNYPNYTMPGTIADAVYASNMVGTLTSGGGVLSGTSIVDELRVQSNVGVGLDWSLSNTLYPIQIETGLSNVSLYARYDITAMSDKRVKRDISVIDDALEKVKRISGYTFSRSDIEDTGTRQCGLIAQELEEVLPEAVHENPATGMKMVAYGNVVSLLVNAIKELDAKVSGGV